MLRFFIALAIIGFTSLLVAEEPARKPLPLVVSIPNWKPVEDESLPERAVARLGRMRNWSTLKNSLIAMPDGKHLLGAFADNRIRLWEAESGKLVATSLQQAHEIHSLSVSRDGKKIAAAGWFGVLVFETDKLDGKGTSLPQQWEFALGAAFSHDGNLVVSTAARGEMRLFELQPYKHRHSFNFANFSQVQALFTPDDKEVLTVDEDDKVKLWRITGGEIRTFDDPNKGVDRGGTLIEPMRLSIHGDSAIGVSSFSGVTIWNRKTGEITQRYRDHTDKAAVSPDGKWLVTARASVIDLKDGKEAFRLPGQQAGIRLFAFSPDSKTLTICDNNETIRRWDLTKRKGIDPASKEIGPPPSGHRGPVTGVVFTPDGKRVISCGFEGTARIWDTATGRELKRLTAPDERFDALDLSADGKLLALGGRSLRFWSMAQDKELAKSDMPFATMQQVRLMPDGQEALVTGGNQVRFHDVRTGKERRPFLDFPHGLHAADVSPNGQTLITAAGLSAIPEDGRITLWDLKTNKEMTRRAGDPSYLRSVKYSPDGRTIAVVYSMVVELWPTPLNEPGMRLLRPKGDIGAIAFSPDSRLLAMVDREDIIVYETATGFIRWSWNGGHVGKINVLAFAPDSRRLASAGEDAVIHIWDPASLNGKKMQPLAADELEQAWSALGFQEGNAVATAIEQMIASPKFVLPFLKERLGPLTLAEQRRIDQLVIDLNDVEFRVRTLAARELEAAAESAVGPLDRAKKSADSEEVLNKADQIIKRIGPLDKPAQSNAARRAIRAIEVLERIGTPEAIELLKTIQKEGRTTFQKAEAERVLQRVVKK